MKDALPIIRHQAYRRLTRAVDAAVKKKPSLAVARTLILNPLDLLRGLASAAVGAINNDLRAIDQFEMAFRLAASDTYEFRDTIRDVIDSIIESVLDEHPRPPSQPTLLDLRSLFLVGLAAGRVGRRHDRVRDFVDFVEAAVLASMPAQALSRTLAAGVDGDSFAALMQSVVRHDPPNVRLRAMAPLLMDPTDHDAFRCIRHLLDLARDFAETVGHDPREWDGATSDDIIEVTRPEAAALRLALGADAEKYFSDIDRVVFASRAHSVGQAIEESFLVQDIPGGGLFTVTVPIPLEARAGFVGVQTPVRRAALYRHRAELIARCTQLQSEEACLRNSTLDLAEVLTEFAETFPSAPADRYQAAWGIRILDLVFRQEDAPMLEGRPTSVIVSLSASVKDGAAEDGVVRIALNDGDDPIDLSVDPDGLTASGEIPAARVGTELVGSVGVFYRNQKIPDDTLAFHQSLEKRPPQVPVPPPEPLSIVILRPAFIVEEDIGLPTRRFRRRPTRTLRVRQVNRAKAEEALEKAKATLAARYTISEQKLPWLNDDEVAVDGDVPVGRDPSAMALLQRMDIMAALSAPRGDDGGPGNIWVALLPSPDEREAERAVLRGAYGWTTGAAAQALTVCPPEALADALNEIARSQPVVSEAQRRIERLRCIGELRNGRLRIREPVRTEIRQAGPGAPQFTEAVAMGIGPDGAQAVSARITTIASTARGPFALMLPARGLQSVSFQVRPEFYSFELTGAPKAMQTAPPADPGQPEPPVSLWAVVEKPARLNQRAVPLGLDKPSGAPVIALTDLSLAGVNWRHYHTRGTTVRVEIELGAAHLWRRVLVAPGARSCVEVDFSRLGPGQRADALRLVASDGWNAVAAVAGKDKLDDGSFPVTGKAMLIRSAGYLRFWVDLQKIPGTDVTWQLWKIDTQTRRRRRKRVKQWKLSPDQVLELDPEYAGLQLVAKADGLSDSIVIPA